MIPNINIPSFKQAYNWMTSLYNPNGLIQQEKTSTSTSTQSQKQLIDLQKLSIPARVQYLKKDLRLCSYNQDMHERISLYYSSIADKFPKFLFTISPPLWVSPLILNASQKVQVQKMVQLQENLISFYGEIMIKISKANCPLFLTITIPKNFTQQMPIFYIKNPQNTINQPTKPNSKYCFVVPQKSKKKLTFGQLKQQKQKYSYQAILGGIKVNLPLKSQTWRWTKQQYYKASNIAKMIQWTIQKLKLQFPFVKNKAVLQNQNQDLSYQQSDSYIKGLNLSKTLKSCLQIQTNLKKGQQITKNNENNFISENKFTHVSIPLPIPIPFSIQLLQSVQKLDVCQKSIKNQNNLAKQEVTKMQLYCQQTEKYLQQNPFSQLFPKPRQKQEQNLLEAICQYQAIKDCLKEFDHLVQRTFQQKLQSKMLSKFQSTFESINTINSIKININQFTKDELQIQMATFKHLSGQLFQKRYNLRTMTERFKNKNKN